VETGQSPGHNRCQVIFIWLAQEAIETHVPIERLAWIQRDAFAFTVCST